MEYKAQAATSLRNSKNLLVTFQYCVLEEKIFRSFTKPMPYPLAIYAYTAEFCVKKQEDYPGIPASAWKLILLVSRQQGIHSAELICRNADDEPYGPLLEATISPTACSAPAVWITWEAQQDRVCINSDYQCSEFAPKGSQPAKTLLPGHLYINLSYRLSRPTIERRLLPNAFTDCALVSNDGRRFCVHRAILANQSSVFLSLFQDAGSPQNGELYFVDLAGDILDTVVKYVYTREIEGKNPAELQELWRVASKYDLVDMKQACVDRLYDGVIKSDVDECYRFGSLFSLDDMVDRYFTVES